MPRRSKDWNEGLARDLKDAEFARKFILASLDEGLSLQGVLRKVVLAMGLKEFSRRAKMPSSNISRVINPKHNPTLASVNRLLKPLGLKLTLAPVENKERAA
jgi:DNA-binding phage protein